MEQIWVQSLSGTVSAFYQRTSGGLLFNAYADGEERKVSGGFIWRIPQESTLDPTKQKLSGLLETRNEMQLDNETLVLQLIRQIQLDKLMQPETEKQIGEEDIRTVSGLPEKEMPRKEIGFRAEIG